MADDRRAEVPDVERLCDIGGGIVKQRRLARAVRARAIGHIGMQRARDDMLCKIVLVKEEVEIAAHAFHMVDDLVAGNLHARHRGACKALRQFCRDGRRRLAQRLAEAEAGEREVAHIGGGGVLKRGAERLGVERAACRGAQRVRKLFLNLGHNILLKRKHR